MTFRGRLMFGASWLACRLPEGPLFRVAELAGDLWYRLAPGRAAQARRNLRRVCTALAASGRGSAPVRAAATDPGALERLVRSAFRHAARYYLEVARNPGITREFVDERLADRHARPHRRGGRARARRSSSSASTSARSSCRRVPGVPGRRDGRRRWRPSTIPACRPGSSGRAGSTASGWSGSSEARRTLTEALRDGIPVGLVGDRDLTGGGIPIPLFGAPAILPIGPAMLAVESGVPVYVMTVRRAGVGRYRGKLDPVDVPARRHAPRARHGDDDRAWRPPSSGSSRTRPSSGGRSSSRSGRTSRRPATRRWGRPHDRAPRRPRSRRPPHPHRRPATGPRPSRRSSTTSSGGRTSTSSRSPTTSGSMPRWPAGRWPSTAGCASRSSSARRSRRSAATCSRSSSTGRSGRIARCARRSWRSTTRAGWPSRPTRSSRTRCAPRAGCSAGSSTTRTRRPIPTGSRRSTRRASGGRGIAGSSASPTSTASPGSATATPTRSRRSGPAGRPSPAGRRTTCGARSRPGRPITAGRSTRPSASSACSVSSSASAAGTCATRCAGRVRRDGTGRDHGYPGGRLRPPRYEVGGPTPTDEPAEIGQAGRP